MERVQIGNGQWFNKETAVEFTENFVFDGRDQISVNTGSQWDHESLFYTKFGKWILHSWSNYQGTIPTYSIVSDERAAKWLVINGTSIGDLSGLPEGTRLAIDNLTAKLEI